MTFQIVDAVRIMDLAVFELVKGAKTIFGNDDRQIVAARDVAACKAKALRIDRPVPVGGRQILVLRVFVQSRNALNGRCSFFPVVFIVLDMPTPSIGLNSATQV